ncbi:MAG: thioredoxin-like domain-containing protein [Candidatus Hinthialibacter antarcticus]|nr:thioredoxin-like domain-containing protein [Candidatus Hinthialibacter antarcticus]
MASSTPRWMRIGLFMLLSVAVLYASATLMNRWLFNMGFGGVAMAGAMDLSGKLDAPELDGGLGWLNVDKPVSINDLKGKVVLIDFWTYCCINCLHVIPDLQKLEKKYPNELVVVGVHSAKFKNEQDSENIRQAVLRYGIEHPVVNDAQFKIWTKYGARGWPHLTVVDPEGKIVGTLSGEGHYDLLDEIISGLIRNHKDIINTQPFPVSLEKDKKAPTVLEFPGKVLADEQSQRLFISDSNHNRIVVSTLAGKVLDIVGGGEPGLKDGGFQDAQFNHPQGMALDGNALYVADTENHAIRKIDFDARTVETVAGVGKQVYARRGGDALKTGLNSPWALVQRKPGGPIYIAMAGPHQLWVLDLAKQTVNPFAGTGREGIVDGVISSSELAQPSGMTTDGVNLYFADSEVSALRKVNMQTAPPRVETLIGTGLFDFGDIDGPFSKARLQHVLGVAYKDGKVYVADTYNHKIKVADLASKRLDTFAGTGVPGVGDINQPQFYEPSGVSIAGDKLFVADTNNHSVRVVDLNTRQVATLNLNLSDWMSKQVKPEFEVFGKPEVVVYDAKTLGKDGRVEIAFEFPEKFHFNSLAKPMVQLRVTGRNSEWVSPSMEANVRGDSLEFIVDYANVDGAELLEAAVTFFYCRDDNQGQCLIGSFVLQGPISSRQGGELKLEYKPRPPRS